MFTKTAQYQAYNLASQTVPKTRQIVMLYDGAVRFAKQAREAIEQKDYAKRFNLLTRVSDIIVNLQAALDFDNGDEIARLLYDYYSSLEARIHYVHRKNDLKILDSVVNELKQMRDAWHEIDTHQGEDELVPVSSESMMGEYTSPAQPSAADAAPSSQPDSPPSPLVDTSKPVFVSA